jgi:hypothetical protein
VIFIPNQYVLYITDIGLKNMSVTCERSVDFSVSWTNKADRHDITEILLKVALNTAISFISSGNGEINRPFASHWQTLSNNVVSSTNENHRRKYSPVITNMCTVSSLLLKSYVPMSFCAVNTCTCYHNYCNQQSYIVAISFISAGNRRKQPTFRKSLTNVIR